MQADGLDRRITIQRFTVGESPSGEPIETWTDLATVWAKVQQQSGREFLASVQEVSERRVVFLIRWMAGLTVLDRVIDDEGNVHDLHEVRRINRKEGIELHATTST